MNSNVDLESLLNENKRLKIEIQQIRNFGLPGDKESIITNYSDKLSNEEKANTLKTKSSQETSHSANYPFSEFHEDSPNLQNYRQKM